MNATPHWLRNTDGARHDGRYADGFFAGAEYIPAYSGMRRIEDELERYAHHVQEMAALRHASMGPSYALATGYGYARPGAIMGSQALPTRYSEIAFERPTGRGPRNYRRPDERILEEVCERIARCGIFAEDLEVSVKEGEVTLTGSVEDRRDKRMIEELADSVFGVSDVHNQVRIRENDRRVNGGSVRASMGARG